MTLKKKTSTKNPPILSHEFVIQNHGDIVSCVAMLFVVGLMVQVTSPLAYMFIALHHNVTSTVQDTSYGVPIEVLRYTYGAKDACAVFFYFLICIVMHAIIQEYILDKFSKRLHLSKSKQSKFNESGQLLFFYVISFLWAGDIMFRENLLLNLSSLWLNYPHNSMVFTLKFFYIIQIAYWLHCYPELYFQKVKREEIISKTLYPTLHLVFIIGAYLLNFTRVGVVLLSLQYLAETFFHAARLIYFSDKSENGRKGGYTLANIAFVVARLLTVTITVLTFWYGLALSTATALDFETGNFNTEVIRIGSLTIISILQAWLMWNFLTFYLRYIKEKSSGKQRPKPTATRKSNKTVQDRITKAKKKREEQKQKEDDDLPEVDQNTKKNLRSRPAAAAQKAK
ncbi:translocating chain-associated membrane protein 1 [Neocloeon triangulifer]|uniref:translocating chain-associated membrane protein 1 n=1 Tax=Neocloeon triangulifer TaxID=2078957 RepID=UPI00286F165E|nr:translocating chain-associated membrane protein 1 [Neocloeon triangulifer]